MDITTITEWIEQQKCVLVLGPDIAYNSQKSLLNELSTFVETKRIKCNFNQDEEFLSSTTKFSPQFNQQLNKFFETLKPTDIYRKIAEIPFHLFVSLSPDLLLKQTFEHKNFEYDFDFYHRNVNPQDVDKPTPQKPLIYNLLGEQTQCSSLVLCFNHLFDYLSSILGNYGLPENLRNEFKETQSVFFLGFKYDKWYFKLILRLLNFPELALRQAAFEEVENKEGIINFYTDEFNFVFLEDTTGEEIINSIHNYFSEKKELRKPKIYTQTAQQITNIINVTGNDNIVAQDIKGNINVNK